jgi:hypothetical protein
MLELFMTFELNGGGRRTPYKAHLKLPVAVSPSSGAVMYAEEVL